MTQALTCVVTDPFEACQREIEGVIEKFHHEDGSITFVVYDLDGNHANPRKNDGNVATLIQENTGAIDIDSDVAGLEVARGHWNIDHVWKGHRAEDLVNRYVAMFRPDIAYYCDYWSAGRSFGWGYVTTDALEEVGWLGAELDHGTPADLFDQEVEIYRQWAEGEVYGYIHLERGEPIYEVDWTGSKLVGHEVHEDSVWGFLGYDALEEVAAQATTSPIIERNPA